MATLLRYISKGKINSSCKSTCQLVFTSIRKLYNEQGLGLPEYKNARQVIFKKYESGLDSFKSKMFQSLGDKNSMVFTEDLKAILHLAEDTPEDAKLIHDMLTRYNNNQDSDMRFGSFVFGPVVMRTLHYLNKPDIALKLFYSEQFDNFFNQISTYMVLLDLLYRNELYSEIRKIYDIITSKHNGVTGHPKMITSIVTKACYKENTQESLNYGLKLCKDIRKKGIKPAKRMIATLSALALKHNSPNIAIELLSIEKDQTDQSLKCVKLMTLANMDNLNNLTLELKDSLKNPFFHKILFFKDTITAIEDAINRMNVPEDSEICDIIKLLKARNVISPISLEEFLMQPIQAFRKTNQPSQKYESQSWSDNTNRNTSWV